MPIALPVWFVAIDRSICLAAPSRTKKLARLRHDPRASFLIESGERWVELLAVHLTGRCELLDLEKDRALIERIDDELDVKYAKFRGDHARDAAEDARALRRPHVHPVRARSARVDVGQQPHADEGRLR